MSNRSLVILSFITLVIIIAAVISNQERAPQTAIETSQLFPELGNRINDVAAISIEGADGAININKQGEAWQLAESGNYPARFDKIKQTALTVADMKVLSPKTTNPSLFAELGVEEVGAGAKSKRLTLKDAGGNTLAALIVGNTRSGRNAEDSGTYVRKADANETWLVSGSLSLSTTPTDWIEQQLLDVADDRIKDTRIEHPDGEVVIVTREQGQKDFSVVDVPEGKVARSMYFINQIGTILSKLQIDNVKPRAGFSFPDTATKTTIRTYDGLVANVTTANIDGLNHITLDFSVDEEGLAAAAAPEQAPAEGQEAIVIGEQPVDAAKQTEAVRKEVADLAAKTADWVYIIPSSKYGLLMKRPTDVLQDPPEEKPAEAQTTEAPAG